MLFEIFMQTNCKLIKLHQLKLGGPVIMPHRVFYKFYADSHGRSLSGSGGIRRPTAHGAVKCLV